MIFIILKVRRRIKLEGAELEEYMKKKQEEGANTKGKTETG